MASEFLLILISVLLVISLIVLKALRRTKRKTNRKPAQNRFSSEQDIDNVFDVLEIRSAGMYGERTGRSMITHGLNEKDVLLDGVEIMHGDQECELDAVIVNEKGVFIIEIKYYNGILYGTEDDHEWRKVKCTPGGDRYTKYVRNPLRQVKRQVWILKEYLKEHNCPVWVEGYVLILNSRSPVESDRILESAQDIDHAVHGYSRNHLSSSRIERIVSLLENA